MAVPARKVSKTRGATRRAHLALSAKATTTCPNCGEVIKAHRVCKNCGTYKNKQVIEMEKAEVKETKKDTKVKESKKETKAKETKKETKKAKTKKSEK